MDTVRLSPPPFSAPQSGYTEDVTLIEEFFTNYKGSITRSSMKCALYDIELDVQDESLVLSDPFKDHLLEIDRATSHFTRHGSVTKFIRRYGTHYSEKTTMGTGIVFEQRYVENETLPYDEQMIKRCHSRFGGHSYMGLGYDPDECPRSLTHPRGFSKQT